ncbi:hypothetical protein [Aureliella helgolandensis]|uniref:Uncharacterized protein n=1 Tax=Aureliella helgolandensis TaxID=2527968 RepID=A0A518G9A6_9BACT|nr:hypothetical protein [Aureliella helgolandensis]QDV25176.1 hypothetical protein Q31a_34990 [Aureliella helgolandensis]
MTQNNFSPLRGAPSQPSIEARWEELRSRIRAEWPELSRDDLLSIDGDSRKLVALVHQKTNANILEIEERIDEIAASSGGLLANVARSTQQFFQDATDRIAEPLRQASQATSKSISNVPVRSAAIAAGVGLLVGLCSASLLKDMFRARRNRFW